MEKNDDYVNVSVRIKPLLADPPNQPNCFQVTSKDPPLLIVGDREGLRPQRYDFDNIFFDKDDQQVVYDDTTKNLVENTKNGYNCTIFAYGPTGTGKTYTMGTNPEDCFSTNPGLLPRAINDLFSEQITENYEMEISVSFIEIYNDKVYDLLGNAPNPLPLKGTTLQSTKEVVFNQHDALCYLQAGIKNRHTGGTKQNIKSSRSHAIFTIYCNVKYSDGGETNSKLTFVDLAGSENVKKAGTEGDRFREGVSINKGLLNLGRVLQAMIAKNMTHNPFRDAVITMVLNDSLKVGNFVSFIICVSAKLEDSSETIKTLDFAKDIKKMRNNRPEVKQILDQYKKDNPKSFTHTPYKRRAISQSAGTPYVTPFKRPLPMRSIGESVPMNPNDDSIKSYLSSSISTVVSEAGAVYPLSPVIKKYMNEMEESLFEKLKTVIQNTVQRVREPERTPEILNKIRREMDTVKSDILQFTAKAMRATSSPRTSPKVARVLNYSGNSENADAVDGNGDGGGDENEALINNKNPLQEISQNLEVATRAEKTSSPLSEESFKKPKPPTKTKRDARRKRVCCCESNENVIPPETPSTTPQAKSTPQLNESLPVTTVVRRRSVRLAEKKPQPQTSRELDDSLEITKVRSTTKHCSVRLQEISNILTPNLRDGWVMIENTASEQRTNIIRLQKKSRFQTRDNAQIRGFRGFTPNRRSSVRIQARQQKSPVTKVLDPKDESQIRHDIITNRRSNVRIVRIQDSPMTRRTKEVLDLLNRGKVKDLQKLQTVGVKTAERIVLFREINGTFKDIKDISAMPQFSKTKFNNFIVQNYLKTN